MGWLFSDDTFGSIAQTLGQPPGFGPAPVGQAILHGQRAGIVSAWGQPGLMSEEIDRGYRSAFAARALGQNLPESAWRVVHAARRGYEPPVSGWAAPWSPYMPGSGVRGGEVGPDDGLDDAVDAALEDETTSGYGAVDGFDADLDDEDFDDMIEEEAFEAAARATATEVGRRSVVSARPGSPPDERERGFYPWLLETGTAARRLFAK